MPHLLYSHVNKRRIFRNDQSNNLSHLLALYKILRHEGIDKIYLVCLNDKMCVRIEDIYFDEAGIH